MLLTNLTSHEAAKIDYDRPAVVEMTNEEALDLAKRATAEPLLVAIQGVASEAAALGKPAFLVIKVTS